MIVGSKGLAYCPSAVTTGWRVLFWGATDVGSSLVLSVRTGSVGQNGPMYFKLDISKLVRRQVLANDR